MIVIGAGGFGVGVGCGSSGGTSGTGGAGAGGAGTGGATAVGGTTGTGTDAATDVAADVTADVATDTGPTNCAGMAISFDSNVPGNADPAKARVMVDFGTGTDGGADPDLPVGNSPRTVELWAYVLSSSWRGDANTMFEYGQVVQNGGFGLDFGTTPAGTIDPYTNGTFDHDNQPSGIADFSTTDQWVHFAMTYDQTAVMLYVNGRYMAGATGVGSRQTVTGGMLATVRSMLTIGGNPRGAYFNGKIDEFRVWNVARSQADIMATMNTTLAGSEAGLVGYWKFDDGAGTTATDSVTSAGHVAHVGTLMATTPAMNPTWVESTAPVHCP